MPVNSLPHITKVNGLKAPVTSLLILLVILSFSLPQAGNDIVDKISLALNSGNVQDLTGHFNNTIDLSLPDSDGTYSNKQAEQLIKAFFKNHPVNSFKLEHQGNSNDGSRYMIGTLKCTSGNTFRVYGLISKSAGTELIQELQFEKE
jgi:hypothetical protein